MQFENQIETSPATIPQTDVPLQSSRAKIFLVAESSFLYAAVSEGMVFAIRLDLLSAGASGRNPLLLQTI